MIGLLVFAGLAIVVWTYATFGFYPMAALAVVALIVWIIIRLMYRRGGITVKVPRF